jgi:pimeloyl-ACP methyl ester carboxylesterase
MTTAPTVNYAKSGDVSVAYLVAGESGPDLVLVPGWASNVEYLWNEPLSMPWLRRLASFCRLIMLDRRGTGLSDRVGGLPSVEERMDDVRAVMDAVGSERAVLFGISEGGPMCITFAATYPERTAALILYGSFARLLAGDDYPMGIAPEAFEPFEKRITEKWGTGVSLRAFVPSLAGDEAVVAAWGRLERLSVSPAGIRAMLNIAVATDVRHILPVLRVPTLVLHSEGDRPVPIALGRYIAEHIPGARGALRLQRGARSAPAEPGSARRAAHGRMRDHRREAERHRGAHGRARRVARRDRRSASLRHGQGSGGGLGHRVRRPRRADPERRAGRVAPVRRRFGLGESIPLFDGDEP